jgi:hypothetical protein
MVGEDGAVDGGQVLQAAGECQALLGAAVERDWARRPPHLEFTVARGVTHLAEGTLWYATDLAAGPERLDTMELRVPPGTAPAELVRTIGAFATVLARVIDASPPEARAGARSAWPTAPGSRPWPAMSSQSAGRVSTSHSQALQLRQALRMRVGHTRPALWVHTDDVARGLAVPFTPPAALARATLERLFPWAPADADPWAALLWANGRIDLPGQERQVDWRWPCAPLEEWDGLNPAGRR